MTLRATSAAIAALVVGAGLALTALPAAAASTDVVIGQVYGALFGLGLSLGLG